jgi:hypothetical protein
VISVFSHNKQGERRVSPSLYKFLLSAHIIASVGWLGLAVAKIVLEIAAVTTDSTAVSEALNIAITMLNLSFPPAAISTIITGVLLSLGTKWGLIEHYWVVTKIVLTVAVIVTATQLGDRIIQLSNSAPTEQMMDYGTILSILLLPAVLLLSLTLAHILMLGVATVLSVYKPWGKTWIGQRKARRPRQEQAIISARGRAEPTHGT